MRINTTGVSGFSSILLAAIAGMLLLGCAAEPRYKGKTLNKWLTLYQGADEASPAEHQAEAAVRAIGTNALPYLEKWILSEDLDQAMRAKLGFQILGPAAAPAVPVLAPMLASTNELVALNAGPALASIGAPAVPAFLTALTNRSYKISLHAILALPDLGTNARPAIPFLLKELKHPNHYYRERAADALGGLHIEPDVVVPALTNLLNDPSPAARFIAINSLGQFGPAALSAVPVIRPFLTDSNFDTAAAIALREIAPEVFTNSPAHRPPGLAPQVLSHDPPR